MTNFGEDAEPMTALLPASPRWQAIVPPVLALLSLIPVYLVWHANFENRITPEEGIHQILVLKYFAKANVIILAMVYFMTRFLAQERRRIYPLRQRMRWIGLSAGAFALFLALPSLLCGLGTCPGQMHGTEPVLAVPLLLVLAMAWGTALSLAPPVTYFAAPRIIHAYASIFWLIIAAQLDIYALIGDRIFYKLLALTIDISSGIIWMMTGDFPRVTQAGPMANPIMHLGDFSVLIAPSCAGAQGITLCFGLIALYMFAARTRLRLKRAAILLVLACISVFLSNALRIALLILVGKYLSAEVAVGGFHSHFGLLASLAVTFGFLWLMQLPWFSRAPAFAANDAVEDEPLPSSLANMPRLDFSMHPTDVVLLLPLAGFLLAGMVVGLASTEFNWLYPLQAVVGLFIAWKFRAVVGSEIARRIQPIDILGGVAVYLIWLALVPLDMERSDLMQEALDSAPPILAAIWIAFRLLGATLVTPLFEELAFRGGLQRMVGRVIVLPNVRIASTAVSLTVSTLAFAAMHGDFLAAVLAGLIYGGLALRRGSIAPAFYAHAITNFLLSVQAIALGQWSYW